VFAFSHSWIVLKLHFSKRYNSAAILIVLIKTVQSLVTEMDSCKFNYMYTPLLLIFIGTGILLGLLNQIAATNAQKLFEGSLAQPL
jgi:hypothetical protein